MSKRLQVLFSDDEFLKLKRHAKRNKQTLGEWVRSALRMVAENQSALDPQKKLNAIEAAIIVNAPIADSHILKKEILSKYLKQI
jgi:hypothetical protein